MTRVRSYTVLVVVAAGTLGPWACTSKDGPPPGAVVDSGLGPDITADMDASPGDETGADVTTAPDTSTPVIDASTSSEASNPDAAEASAPDASDGGAGDVLLFAGIDTNANAWGASFAAGAWSATNIGANLYAVQGGGLAVTASAQGVAVFRDDTTPTVKAATWTGSWPQLAALTPTANAVGAPVAGGTGALLVYQSFPVGFAQFDAPSATWSSGEATGASSDNDSVPGAVGTMSGSAVALFTGTGALGTTYGYAVRSSPGTWTAPASIPGSAYDSSLGSPPAIVSVRVPGTDTLVAAMNGSTSGTIDAAVYTAGTWSSAVHLVTDAATAAGRPFSLAALPGGRAALAYVDATSALRLGFYSGSWTSFQVVPGTGTGSALYPISIARGAFGQAVVEMVYLDGTGSSLGPKHVRLTSEAMWTWSAPFDVAAASFEAAYVAVGP